MKFRKITWMIADKDQLAGIKPYTFGGEESECDDLDDTFEYENEDEAIQCYCDMLADRSSPIEGYIDNWDTKDGFTTYYDGEPVYKLYNFKCIPIEEE